MRYWGISEIQDVSFLSVFFRLFFFFLSLFLYANLLETSYKSLISAKFNKRCVRIFHNLCTIYLLVMKYGYHLRISAVLKKWVLQNKISSPSELIRNMFFDFQLRHCCVDDPSDLCSVNIAGKEMSDVKEEDFEMFDNVAYVNAAENYLPLGK